MTVLNFLIPEILLITSILVLLMVGVFIKNSFEIIYRSSIFLTLLILLLILTSDIKDIKIFNDSFVIDDFSIYLKILILLSTFFIFLISQRYITDINNNKFEYPIIVLLSILGMFFMVSSNDLILFYLGLELQSLSLYILASIDRDNLRSTESGVKYFVLSALSSGLLLYGCSLLYGFTGSTNFELIADQLNKENTGAVFAMVFILVGLAFKVSAVPFHMWTPDVYEGAPTSITSYFAVVPKVAGLALLIKFMFVPFSNILLEWQTIIIFISIASMILGAVAAMIQKNLKRLLAYSSIGHIGYLLIGLASANFQGIKGLIIYVTINQSSHIFWALIFIYIWAGPHHLLYSALPEWAQNLGVAFSVMLIAPSWGGMINGLLTLRGAWDKVRVDPVLKFMVVAITGYGMATFEGPMLSLKNVNAIAHFSDWIIAHVHVGALAWNGFLTFGMIYWLVPRLFKTKLYLIRILVLYLLFSLSPLTKNHISNL